MATKKKQQQSILVADALALLRRAATKKDLANLPRFGITVAKGNAYGVSMANLQKIAKSIGGTDHELAAALWKNGLYEARMLACLIDDARAVTAEQMDAWCDDFDNWAIVDTACFKLFDRTPHAWTKIEEWAERQDEEMVVRASFALLASVALHDKEGGAATDAKLKRSLALCERAARADDRNFVKKAVSWALKGIASRNRALYDAVTKSCEKLRDEKNASASGRWVANDVLRELRKPAALQRVSGPKTKSKKKTKRMSRA